MVVEHDLWPAIQRARHHVIMPRVPCRVTSRSVYGTWNCLEYEVWSTCVMAEPQGEHPEGQGRAYLHRFWKDATWGPVLTPECAKQRCVCVKDATIPNEESNKIATPRDLEWGRSMRSAPCCSGGCHFGSTVRAMPSVMNRNRAQVLTSAAVSTYREHASVFRGTGKAVRHREHRNIRIAIQ